MCDNETTVCRFDNNMAHAYNRLCNADPFRASIRRRRMNASATRFPPRRRDVAPPTPSISSRNGDRTIALNRPFDFHRAFRLPPKNFSADSPFERSCGLRLAKQLDPINSCANTRVYMIYSRGPVPLLGAAGPIAKTLENNGAPAFPTCAFENPEIAGRYIRITRI
jgi:hypothetical protein